MKFKLEIEINMDNAAFDEDPQELQHILQSYVNTAALPHAEFINYDNLRDVNGNTVGQAHAEVTR